MIKQNFYLKSDKVNLFEECPIFLKLIYQGKSTTLSTGKWITKKRWLSINKLKNPLRIDKEKNCKLAIDRIAERIENIYYKLLKTSDRVSVLDVKNEYTGKIKKNDEIDILLIFRKQNEHFKRKVLNGEKSKPSLQKYERAKSLIEDYVSIRLKKNSYSIKNIDKQFVYNLESFLKYESTKRILHNFAL